MVSQTRRIQGPELEESPFCKIQTLRIAEIMYQGLHCNINVEEDPFQNES